MNTQKENKIIVIKDGVIMKEFKLNGKIYCFEYNGKSERKVKLFQKFSDDDLYGNQKEVIVKKLNELIQQNSDIEIKENIKKYIKDYCDGICKDASQTTNSLGKILYDYLE